MSIMPQEVENHEPIQAHRFGLRHGQCTLDINILWAMLELSGLSRAFHRRVWKPKYNTLQFLIEVGALDP